MFTSVFKKTALYLFLAFFCSSALAEEPGYREALQYFIYRKNKKANKRGGVLRSSDRKSAELQEFLPEPYKFFLSLGMGESLGLDFQSVEVGAVVLAGSYFQQSVSLEYNRYSTDESEAFKSGELPNKFATGVFLNHSISLNSRKFFLSPDLTMGVGRFFDQPSQGALIILKPGLVLSSRWGKGFVLSAHVYYRRNQYFSKNSHGDGLGFHLRVAY